MPDTFFAMRILPSLASSAASYKPPPPRTPPAAPRRKSRLRSSQRLLSIPDPPRARLPTCPCKAHREPPAAPASSRKAYRESRPPPAYRRMVYKEPPATEAVWHAPSPVQLRDTPPAVRQVHRRSETFSTS